MAFRGYIVNVKRRLCGMQDGIIGSRDRIRVKTVPG